MHPIDNIFHDGLADKMVVPSPAVWDRIEQTLDKGAGRKAYISLSVLMMVAGFALAIGLAGVLYFAIGNDRFQAVTANAPVLLPESENNNSNSVGKSHEAMLAAEVSVSIEQQTPVAVLAQNSTGQLKQSNGPSTYEMRGSRNAERGEMQMVAAKGFEVALVDAKMLVDAKAVTLTNKTVYYPLWPVVDADASAKQNEKNFWMVGGVVSPSHVYRTIDGSESSQSMVTEGAMTALNGSLVVKYGTGKRWVFESGVGYARVGQSVTPKPTNALTQQLGASADYVSSTQTSNALRQNSLGKVVSKSFPKAQEQADAMFFSPKAEALKAPDSGVSEIKQMLDYIEVPFTARYFVTRKKHASISIAGGLSANFLVGNSAKILFSDGSSMSGETQNINDITYGSQVGVGVDVPLMTNLTMTVEPIFKYFLSSANSGADYDFRPYSFGMNAGVSYRF
jgi:hypothetical protein